MSKKKKNINKLAEIGPDWAGKIVKLPVLLGIFFCIIVLTSSTIGFFTLNPFLILGLSLVISFFLFKYIPKYSISKIIPILAILIFILLAYPVLMITPFYPASADAATTTAVRAIGDSIPLDYGQYGKLHMSYQIGFPLIANVFSDLFPVMQDFQWIWLLAVLGGVLQLFFFYLFTKELFKSESLGIVSTVLFFSGKLVFENLYVGEFAWVFATALMFLFLWLMLKKSSLQFIVFPTIFVIHPAVGLNLSVFMTIYYLFNKVGKKHYFLSQASRLLVIPIILVNYSLPVIYNALFNQGVFFHEYTEQSVIYALVTLTFWVGTGLTLFFAVLLVALLNKTRGKKFFDEYSYLWIILFVSIAIFIGAVILSTISVTELIAGRVVELIIISLILLTALFIKKLNLEKSKVLLAVIIVVSLFFFFNSSILTHYRSGSKVTLESREFSQAFYNFDKEQKVAIFLMQGGGKIAEYSNKIPFDINQEHSVFSYNFSYYPDEGFEQYETNSRIRREIISNHKLELLNDINVEYIVAKKSFLGINYPIAFEFNDFVVYKRQ